MVVLVKMILVPLLMEVVGIAMVALVEMRLLHLANQVLQEAQVRSDSMLVKWDAS